MTLTLNKPQFIGFRLKSEGKGFSTSRPKGENRWKDELVNTEFCVVSGTCKSPYYLSNLRYCCFWHNVLITSNFGRSTGRNQILKIRYKLNYSHVKPIKDFQLISVLGDTRVITFIAKRGLWDFLVWKNWERRPRERTNV